MLVNLVPDMSLAAAPLAQVLKNAFSLATQTDSDSLISYSAPARVEPMTLIDSDLALYEDMPKVMSAVNNLFSCYYIAAVTRSLNVDSLRLLRSIDHLKPNRSTLGALGDFAEAANRNTPGYDGRTVASRVESRVIEMVGESIGDGLSLPRYHHVGLEAVDAQKPKILFRVASEKEKKEFDRKAREESVKALEEQTKNERKLQQMAQARESTVKKGSVDYLEPAHLITGKVFELSAKYGDNSVTVQVSVSLDPRVTRPGNIVDIYAVGGELRTAKERWDGLRSGKLRMLQDIILCSDLIDNELRVGIHDETGSFLQNRENDAGNKLSAILTGKRSVGTASGICLMSGRTARRLESAIGGKLDDFSTREKAMRRTYSLLMLVLDPERDIVTVYHRGLSKVNTLPISEFIRSKSKDGSDVTDIVKLFLSGSAPTL